MNQKGDFMMIKFGTGGWRAIIGDDFTKQNIQTLAKALATKMKDEGVKIPFQRGNAVGGCCICNRRHQGISDQ